MQKEYSAKSNSKGMDEMVEKVPVYRSSKTTIEHRNTVHVDISFKTILMILGTILAVYLGTKLLQVIGLIFFAFILSSAAFPLVKGLTNKKVPKTISILLVYFLIIALLTGVITLIFVPFATESQKLLVDLPGYITRFMDQLSGISLGGNTIDVDFLNRYFTNVIDWIDKLIASGSGTDGIKTALGTVFSVAGGFISLVTMLILSVYIVTDHDNFIDVVLLRIVEGEKRARVRQLVIDVETKLGHWLIGQLTLSFVIGFLTWLLLTVVGVPFALPLAVLAGLLESIPSLGPTISAVPTVLVALLAGGPAMALITFVGSLIIQQLENTVIVPRVMSNAVGLKPVVVVIAVTAGFTLLGPIGALLSIPIVVVLEIFYQFFLDLQKLKAKGVV